MRVIVIGAGEVGVNVSRNLVNDGHDVTVIERDPVRAAALEPELDALVVSANGASPKVLSEYEAGKADLLAAVTESDEVNIIAALGAQQLGAKATVARVGDPDFYPDPRESARGIFGIDLAINPDRATAYDIAEAILLPGAVSVEYFAERQLALAEVILTEDSYLVGIPLAARERHEPAYIVGHARAGQATLSTGEDVLQPGDHILVAAGRDAIGAAVARFAGRTQRVRECVIFGGGRIGYRLAQRLERTPIRTTVLEAGAERARFLAENLPKTAILHDEGVSQESQRLAGVADADAFVACAGDDRANLLAARNAKDLGAGLCVSVVSREEFTPLVDALNIDAAYSPRLITAEAIIRFAHTRSVMAIHLLQSGFEAVELQAEAGSEIVGSAVGETGGLLAGTRVGAILREDEVLIPRRGTEIEAGDRMLILGVDGTLSGIEPAFTAT